MQIEAARAKHLTTFVGRKPILSQITESLEEGSKQSEYILVQGPEGIGKSALVCQLSEQLSETQRTHSPPSETSYVAPWLAGCLLHLGKFAADPESIVRCLVDQAATLVTTSLRGEATAAPWNVADIRNREESKPKWGGDPISGTRVRLSELLYSAMESVAVEAGRCVVIVDAMDEVLAQGGTAEFLPPILPPNCVVLLTAQADQSVITRLRHLVRSRRMTVPRLDLHEVAQITGIQDPEWSGKLLKSSGGRPLFVAMKAREVAIAEGARPDAKAVDAALFTARVQSWSRPSFKTTALYLLAIFEEIAPLSTDEIVGFLNSQDRACTAAELQDALRGEHNDIDGVETNGIKLSVRAFGRFVLKSRLSKKERLSLMRDIANWLRDDRDVRPETAMRFLHFWTDRRKNSSAEFGRAATQWLTSPDLAGGPERLFQIYLAHNRLYGSGNERGYAWDCLQAAAQGEYAPAMRVLGSRLVSVRGARRDPTRGARFIQGAADAGEANAMFEYGGRLLLGDGIPKDATEGLKYLRDAVEVGHAGAMVFLARQYWHGEHVPQDRDAGEGLFIDAAQTGRHHALIELGQYLVYGHACKPRIADGIALLEEAASRDTVSGALALAFALMEQGDSERGLSMIRSVASTSAHVRGDLARSFITDKGPIEHNEAKEWLRESAAAGDAPSMLFLARNLLDGKHFFSKDATEGSLWLERAVASGSSIASVEYATRQFKGNGLPKSEERAVQRLEQLAHAEHPAAIGELCDIYLTADTRWTKFDRGRELAERGIEAGNLGCATMLGMALYRKGLSVPGKLRSRYFQEAAEVFGHASERGSTSCSSNLGYMVRRGEATLPADVDKVSDLFGSAETGAVAAVLNLALLLLADPDADLGWANAVARLERDDLDPDEVRRAGVWWSDTSAMGDAEGDVVLLLLHLAGHATIDGPDMVARHAQSAQRGGWPVPSYLVSHGGVDPDLTATESA